MGCEQNFRELKGKVISPHCTENYGFYCHSFFPAKIPSNQRNTKELYYQSI